MKTTANERKQWRTELDTPRGWSNETVQVLLDDIDELLALLREVSRQGVEESDTRMDWFNLQMDKDLWAEIQEVAR